MKKSFRYAYVILNYHTANDVYRAVQSILSLSDQQNEFIILIVDVQPIERLQLNYKNVYILPLENNGGYAYGNNQGLNWLNKHVNLEYVVIMNPDVLLHEKNTTSRLIDRIEEIHVSDSSIVGGQPLVITGNSVDPLRQVNIRRVQSYKEVLIEVFYPLKSLFRKSYQHLLYLDQAPYHDEIKYHVPAGSFFIIHFNYFFQIMQGFDERTFLFEEEMMLGAKLKQADKYLLFQPQFSVLHEQGKSTNSQGELTPFTFKETKKSKKIYLINYLNCGKFKTSFALGLFTINFYAKTIVKKVTMRGNV